MGPAPLLSSGNAKGVKHVHCTCGRQDRRPIGAVRPKHSEEIVINEEYIMLFWSKDDRDIVKRGGKDGQKTKTFSFFFFIYFIQKPFQL